jgi:MinD superfamily P-loop ATPase
MTAPARFRQVDIKRALKACEEAGIPAKIVLEPDGKITIIPGRFAEDGERNPWDDE